VDRLIEKIFNYLKRPVDWIRNKASNSKNIVFVNEFKQINSFVVVIENFITKKTPIEKLYFKLSKIKKHGEKLMEKLRVFLGKFLYNWNNKIKLSEDFLELLPYLTEIGNALKIEENETLIQRETDRDITTNNELKKSVHEIVKYTKEFSNNLKNKLNENPVKNYKKDLSILEIYFEREIKVR